MINQNEQFMNITVTKNHSAEPVIKDIQYLCIDTNQEWFMSESSTKSQFNSGVPMALVCKGFNIEY